MTSEIADITPSEAQHIAELAHLSIESDRLDEVSAGLSAILEFGNQLQDIDTVDVESTSQVTGLTDILREDEVITSEVTPKELLAAAPSREGQYFKVRRVLK